MAFMDWLVQSEENHYLFELGIEGVHWNAVGDNQYEIPESLNEPYVFPCYQLTGNPNMMKYNVELPQSAIKFKIWQQNREFRESPLIGFQLKIDSFKTEKASVDAIYSVISSGIMTGSYEDPIAILKQANADAQKAGLEKMREETIRQVQEFLDNK